MKWRRPTEGEFSRRNVLNGLPKAFDELFRDQFWTNEYAGFVPAVNVWEDKEQFNIDLSAPGFQKDSFKLKVTEDVLAISGEYKTEEVKEEKNFSLKEFNAGSFSRSFHLPENADVEKISAKYENGILHVMIAKKEEGKAKFEKEISVS
jgi:HSP20 family protein